MGLPPTQAPSSGFNIREDIEQGPTLSRYMYPATPKDNPSYHPDNPRRHGSQLSTALMMFHRYAFSRVSSLDCTLFNEHIVINITFTFPFSTNRTQTAQLGGLEKSFTDNETTQLKVDMNTDCCYIPHTNPIHSQYRVCPPRLTSGKQ